jgi:hypothetical protein
VPPNKQLQRTVMPRRGRAASASFHCALAARSTRQRAAGELRRYAARTVILANIAPVDLGVTVLACRFTSSPTDT